MLAAHSAIARAVAHAGRARMWDQFVVRASLEDRKAVGFNLKDGVVGPALGITVDEAVAYAVGCSANAAGGIGLSEAE